MNERCLNGLQINIKLTSVSSLVSVSIGCVSLGGDAGGVGFLLEKKEFRIKKTCILYSIEQYRKGLGMESICVYYYLTYTDMQTSFLLT